MIDDKPTVPSWLVTFEISLIAAVIVFGLYLILVAAS